MNIVKFELMLKEFPFLEKILRECCRGADGIETILVRRADENVLEVRPYHYSHECMHSESGWITWGRLFWKVTASGDSKALSNSFDSETASGEACVTNVHLIGYQLTRYHTGDVRFLVECHLSDQGELPTIVVYKMQRLDWETHCWQRWPRKEWELKKASA